MQSKDKKKNVEVSGEFCSRTEEFFRMISSAVLSPKPYKKVELPSTVTVTLPPEYMEVLHILSLRLGAKRTQIGSQILMAGIVDAAKGCGFTPDEDGNIPDEQKNWDTASKKYGFGFPSVEEEN